MSVDQSTGPSTLDNLAIMAADYTPSDDLKAAIRAYEDAKQYLADKRERLREAIGHEMLSDPDATTGTIAKHVEWSDETLRGISREFKVPRKRPPTVRSIKDKSGADAAG